MNYQPTKDLLNVIMNTYSPEKKAIVIAESLDDFNSSNPDFTMLSKEEINAVLSSITDEDDQRRFNEAMTDINAFRDNVKNIENTALVILGKIEEFENNILSLSDAQDTADLINRILQIKTLDNDSKNQIIANFAGEGVSLSRGYLKFENNECYFDLDEEIEEEVEATPDEIYEGISLIKTLASVTSGIRIGDIPLNIFKDRVEGILKDLEVIVDSNSEDLGYTFEEISLMSEEDFEAHEHDEDCC